MKNNIILIGFMGVGKGALARKFSKKTSLYAIDTDDVIESLENTSIKKMFSKKGEEYFRSREQECAYWLQKCVKNTIISTGGGFHKVKNLNKIGDVIYLRSSFEGILKRLQSHSNSRKKFKKRPLLSDIKKARELYKKRVKEYEKVADIIIDVEGKEPKKIIKEILRKL